MQSLISVVLRPLGALYGLIMRFRNHLYDIGYKKSFQFQTGVISVGNLSLGGNGKTPMVEYLIRLLLSQYRIAVLSRGYGRSTRGFILATTDHTASDLGDEPMQLFMKFKPSVAVAVGESRALAIPKILFERPEVDLIILDDAFQHRSVIPDLSILVTDYQRPFFKDFVVPAGRLREPRSGVSRSDVVVVTKCPNDISDDQRRAYIREVRKYHQAPVFFSTIAYGLPQHFITGNHPEDEVTVLLVTGIANPGSMVDYVSGKFRLAAHLQYRDHFNFSNKQILEIMQRFSQISGDNKIVLTTEKDTMRLMNFKDQLNSIPLYYLPIESKLVSDHQQFNDLILNRMSAVASSTG